MFYHLWSGFLKLPVNYRDCLCDNWKPGFLPCFIINYRKFSRQLKARWSNGEQKINRSNQMTIQNTRNKWCQSDCLTNYVISAFLWHHLLLVTCAHFISELSQTFSAWQQHNVWTKDWMVRLLYIFFTEKEGKLIMLHLGRY